MSKKKAIILVVIAVVVTNIITVFFTAAGFNVISNTLIDVQGVSFKKIVKYNKVKDLLNTKYVEEVNDNKLMEGSIKGMVNAVEDPYTAYMSKKEFKNLQIYTNANYAGIGVVVGVDPKDNLIMISEVFENSPAESSKLMAGDKIIKVNETEVNGDDFEKAVSMIRGKKGTTVNITVLREGEDKPLDKKVTRDEIEIKTVRSKKLSEDIGYVRIIQFADNTSNEFKDAIERLKNKGAKKLVIDVRDNPGGLLTQVVEICDKLLSRGLVVYTVDNEGQRQNYYSKGKGMDVPFVVLINGRSASASEILAGAVRDYEEALLVGSNTYGKGVVQSVFKLGDGSGVKITTSKYYTPKGVSINKVGVKPDIEVKLQEKYQAISKLEFEEDVQLQKAIEVLKQQ